MVKVINGIIIKGNYYGKVLWCSHWEVLEKFSRAGLIGRKFYKAHCGHVDYYIFN